MTEGRWKEAALALARIDPDAILTIQVRAGDYARALEEASGGPAVLTTRECAARYGWRDADWRRWAPELEGAQLIGRAWRIPREAVERKVASLMKRPDENEPTSHRPRRGGNHGKFRSKATVPSSEGVGPAIIPLAGRVHRR